MNEPSTSVAGDSRQSIARALGVSALALAAFAAYCWWERAEPYDVDSKHYQLMAEGRIAEASRPFTSRIFSPWLARQVARVSGLSLDGGFMAVGVASCVVLFTCGALLVCRYAPSAALAAAIIITPPVLLLCRDIYMPDGLHAALMTLFFLLISRGRWWWAVPLLPLMQITRESTIVAAFFFVLVALLYGRWKAALVAVLLTAVGMGVVAKISAQGKPNIHGVSVAFYMAAKIPANFTQNVLGLRTWTNTYAEHNPEAFPDEPLFTMPAPKWLPGTGKIERVGIYKFEPRYPLGVLSTMLTIFGVMPSVVLYVLFWRRSRIVRKREVTASGQLGLLYGTTSYFLGTAIGTSLDRLLYYGWPLSWVAAPELLWRYFKLEAGDWRRLAAMQAVVCWLPLVLVECNVTGAPMMIIAAAAALPCHVATIRLLRRRRVDEPAPKGS